MITKVINGKKYNCLAPEECTSPIKTEVVKILIDKNDYVLALIKYRNETNTSLGIRWYASDTELENNDSKTKCMGYPNTRGRPTWFVLPNNVMMDIQEYLQNSQKD